MKYVYPAIFRCAINEGKGGYYVEFPDLGVFTFGETLYEAIYMAEDLLALEFICHEDFRAGTLTDIKGNKIEDWNETILPPTPIKTLIADLDKYSSEEFIEDSTDAFVILIRADTEVHRLLWAQMSLLL